MFERFLVRGLGYFEGGLVLYLFNKVVESVISHGGSTSDRESLEDLWHL